MKKLAFGFICLLGLSWISLVCWGAWVNAHWIAAGPANQSLFLRSYNPTLIVKKFQYDEGFQIGQGSGASSGIRSVRHTAEFVPGFIIWANRKQELLNALREDVLSRLRTTRTIILSAHDEADGGFTYNYAAGNSIGSISVKAPVHGSGVQRRYQLAPGLEDISVDIALQETWTRPANETKWWMAALD